MVSSDSAFIQLDGNVTIVSESSDICFSSDWLPHSNITLLDSTQPEEDDNVQQPIQVITGNRTDGWNSDSLLPGGWISKCNNITVKRDNRLLLGSKMPTIFVTNHRSFFSKFNNFVEAMETLELTLGLHSEIWEDKEKKSHTNSIEEAFELKGIQYISNPRPNRRGGGAAISLLPGEFTLTKLDVVTPKNLEVVWGLVCPKKPTTEFKGIIVCSFYRVPYSKRKTQLVQHIAINYTEWKTKYKDYFFLTGGDKNDLEIRHILDISNTLHMHNTKPTYGQKNIDVLVSDFVHLFSKSQIIPNVPTGIPDGQPGGGKTSDHPIVVCVSRMEIGSKPARRVAVKKARRVDSNKMRLLAEWIQHESWEKVFDGNGSSGMAEKLIDLVKEKMEDICPLEEVKISQLDGKITSLALQRLTRSKKREYSKHGSAKKFHELKKKVNDRIKVEGEKALEKVFENSKGKGTKWIREASRLS